MSAEQTTNIRITIYFADGKQMDTGIDAEEGAFSFVVQSDCPAITRIAIAAPKSAVEFLPGGR